LGLCNLTVRFLLWLSKAFLIQTLNYLKWNLQVINKLGE